MLSALLFKAAKHGGDTADTAPCQTGRKCLKRFSNGRIQQRGVSHQRQFTFQNALPPTVFPNNLLCSPLHFVARMATRDDSWKVFQLSGHCQGSTSDALWSAAAALLIAAFSRHERASSRCFLRRRTPSTIMLPTTMMKTIGIAYFSILKIQQSGWQTNQLRLQLVPSMPAGPLLR